jgi:hypothetical protein
VKGEANMTSGKTKDPNWYRDLICDIPHCYNRPASGYTICISCLHGVAEKADLEVIAAKKASEKQLKEKEKN